MRKKRILCILIFLLHGLIPNKISGSENFVAFLVGYDFVETITDSTEHHKSLYLLEQITGYTVKKAMREIARFKSRPSEWKKVLQEKRELLEELKATPQKVPDADDKKK